MTSPSVSVTPFTQNGGRITITNKAESGITEWHLVNTATSQPTWIMGMKIFSTKRNEWVSTQGLAGGIPANSMVDIPYIGTVPPKLTIKLGKPSDVPAPAPAPNPVPAPLPKPSPTTTFDFPRKIFAPYVDILLWPTPSIYSVYEETGQKYFTLAFLTAAPDNKSVSWGSVIPLEKKFYMEEIEKIRSVGGDVIVSFGGANSHEIATQITDPVALQKVYQDAIDMYKLKCIDFDLEGAYVLSNTESIDRRNKVIKKLQEANPNLLINYCLPCTPQGLDYMATNIMVNAVKNGVKPHAVGLMTFDYGSWGWGKLDPQTQMDQMAINACTNVKSQLDAMGLQYNGMIMIPMIGRTDVAPETFTLANATNTLTWSQSKTWMHGLSFWSMSRDKPGDIGRASPTASGTDAQKSAYTNIYKAFTCKY